MTQAENDLEQLKQSMKELSNVYKSQVALGTIDNATLTQIHDAIVNINTVINWLSTKRR